MNYKEAIETIREAAKEADVDVDDELRKAENVLISEGLLKNEDNLGAEA